jgi:16S rRNA processing protein RimM
MNEWDTLVTVGRIVRPHGIRGQVVVAPETDFGAARFAAGSVLRIRVGESVRELVVDASREYDGRWVVGFAGVTTMNEAETLRNAELRVPPEGLHALEADRFYVHDLVDCDVVTATGQSIGRVTRVELGTGTPLLVVDAGKRGEVLVPMADTICRRIDVAGKRIEIDPPEGLIDLNKGRS